VRIIRTDRIAEEIQDFNNLSALLEHFMTQMVPIRVFIGTAIGLITSAAWLIPEVVAALIFPKVPKTAPGTLKCAIRAK